MMRLLLAIAAAVPGYCVSAGVGYFVIRRWAGNQHDRSVEAAMTACFVAGPVGAFVAILIAYACARF